MPQNLQTKKTLKLTMHNMMLGPVSIASSKTARTGAIARPTSLKRFTWYLRYPAPVVRSDTTTLSPSMAAIPAMLLFAQVVNAWSYTMGSTVGKETA